MKLKSLFFTLLISSSMFANHEFSDIGKVGQTLNEKIEQVYSWTEYITFAGIKVDYKFEECSSDLVKNQVLVLFRFSNLTNDKRSFSWTLEVYRDNQCTNCERIENPEYSHELILEANEVIQGDCSSKENKALYVFGNFVKLSPGMTEQFLTNFKFINLHSAVVK